MERKHTKGPWEVVVAGGERGKTTIAHSAQFAIISGAGDERDIETKVADAFLIAAAPDLLEALEELLAHATFAGIASHYEMAARSAIAKAEGKNPTP